MKKILVPTDFSSDSKSGIRFAIHWAAQQKLELVFIHVLNMLIPTGWSRMATEKYIGEEMNSCDTRFKKFISGVYKSMNMQPDAYSTIIVQGFDPGKTVLDYCRKNTEIDCVCISTRGAGKLMKLFGTNTAFLISKSKIPVVAIPRNYKPVEIKSVLYATDFRNYKEEIVKVLQFASAFKARIDVLHFSWPGDMVFDEQIIEAVSGNYEHGLKACIMKNDGVLTLTENLQKQIKIRKPSVVILFTHQQRSLIGRILFPGQAHELSFRLKTPLLVFSKFKAPAKTQGYELA